MAMPCFSFSLIYPGIVLPACLLWSLDSDPYIFVVHPDSGESCDGCVVHISRGGFL